MYKCLFFLLLQSCFVQAQNHDKNIYQTILDSSAKQGEFFFVVCKRTDSKELKKISWEEKYNRLNIVFFNQVDTSWKETLIKANRNDLNELSLNGVLASSIKFISNKRIKKLFKKDVANGWNSFYSEYPKAQGFRDFSRIIYSTDNKKAIVYLGVHRGGLNGLGTIYFLTYENDKWVINRKIDVWVA